MSKQTAVEWLVEQLLANALLRLTKDEHSVYKELKEQAKAMEREQMRVTYNQGLMSDFQNFEEYYNSTYKGGEQ